MKKLLAMVLTVSMTAAMVGCGQAAETTETAAESTAVETVESTAAEETATESTEESTAAEEAAGDVLSYADYVAADLDSEVTIESYVQANSPGGKTRLLFIHRTRTVHTSCMTWLVPKKIMKSSFPA